MWHRASLHACTPVGPSHDKQSPEPQLRQHKPTPPVQHGEEKGKARLHPTSRAHQRPSHHVSVSPEAKVFTLKPAPHNTQIPKNPLSPSPTPYQHTRSEPVIADAATATTTATPSMIPPHTTAAVTTTHPTPVCFSSYYTLAVIPRSLSVSTVCFRLPSPFHPSLSLRPRLTCARSTALLQWWAALSK